MAPSKRRLNLVIHDFGRWARMSSVRDTAPSPTSRSTRARGRLRRRPRARRAPGIAPRSARDGLVRAFDAQASETCDLPRRSDSRGGGLVSGRRVTAYENCRWEIEAAGATYVASEQAVRDGRIVTGQTWQSHPEFYRLVFACLSE
jgi:protease I